MLVHQRVAPLLWKMDTSEADPVLLEDHSPNQETHRWTYNVGPPSLLAYKYYTQLYKYQKP